MWSQPLFPYFVIFRRFLLENDQKSAFFFKKVAVLVYLTFADSADTLGSLAC